MEDVKVAIVGLGHVARHQIEALRLVDGMRFAAAYDVDATRSQGLPEGVQWSSSLGDLLRRPDIQMVVVAVPTREHHRVGMEVLEAGKWLVVEKPAAERRDEFDALVAKASGLGQRMSVALHAAFGLEALWFRERVQRGEIDLGPLSGFMAGFYDPYAGPEGFSSDMRSLGGSWMDSGVNALSVLAMFLDLSSLRIDDGRFTRVPALEGREIQATVECGFETSGVQRRGLIDTNWSLGRDSKVTRLFFDRDVAVVTLDHSAQRVSLTKGGKTEVLYDGSNEVPRLTNHYVGVFVDLARQHSLGRGNLDIARPIHEIFYAAFPR